MEGILTALEQIDFCRAKGIIYMSSNMYSQCLGFCDLQGRQALIPENKIDYCRLFHMRVEIDNTIPDCLFKAVTGKSVETIDFTKEES